MAILDPGFDLNLRPMKYPELYEMYTLSTQKNHWSVTEVNFNQDKEHLRRRLNPAQRKLVSRLVAFFATGDNIVANNLVLNLYRHVNSPEARQYYSRQLFEESVHVDFYLKLVEAYIEDEDERAQAFKAVDNIPSIKLKSDFMHKWIQKLVDMDRIKNDDDKRTFLMGMIVFACAVEGLFFMGAFAYVYYLRSKGLLPGLAEGTDWVFRDETQHMKFAFMIIDIVRKEEPHLFTPELEAMVDEMFEEAILCEEQFCEDATELGVLGFTKTDMSQFLRFQADRRKERLGMTPRYNAAQPFDFMVLQDLQSLVNFFERRVTEYQANTTGEVSFEEEF